MPEETTNSTDRGLPVVGDVLDGAQRAVAVAVDAVKPRLRGVLHEGAFFTSIVTGLVLVSLAPTGRSRLAAVVYSLSVMALFGTSALYHRRTWSPAARRVMKRLDHSMIFVLIAGSYTPFALLILGPGAGWVVLSVVWGGAILGVALRMLFLNASRWLTIPLYIGLGWVGAFIVPGLLHGGGVTVLVLILVAGAFYTAGAVVYAAKHPDPDPRTFGYHEVFHALTIAAFVCLYVAVSFAVYRDVA